MGPLRNERRTQTIMQKNGDNNNDIRKHGNYGIAMLTLMQKTELLLLHMFEPNTDLNSTTKTNRNEN